MKSTVRRFPQVALAIVGVLTSHKTGTWCVLRADVAEMVLFWLLFKVLNCVLLDENWMPVVQRAIKPTRTERDGRADHTQII